MFVNRTITSSCSAYHVSINTSQPHGGPAWTRQQLTLPHSPLALSVCSDNTMVKSSDGLSQSFHNLMQARVQTLTGTPQRSTPPSASPQTPIQSGPRRRLFMKSEQGVSEQLKQVSFAFVDKEAKTPKNILPAIQNHTEGVRRP